MSKKEMAPFSKQKISERKMTRIVEEKKMVRDYIIGRGRKICD